MKASLSIEADASHTHSTIHEDITANADVPPQPPSPAPVTASDIVIDDPSLCSLSTEHIEQRPLDRTHSPYDIV